MDAGRLLLLAFAAVAAACGVWGRRRRAGLPESTGQPFALVISLAGCGDRLARFRARYAACDFSDVPLERLQAADGRALRDDQLRALVRPDALARLDDTRRTGTRVAHRDLTPGAVGCYLSHLRAWQRVAGSDVPYAFVFEDDADLAPDALARFGRACAQAAGDWDVMLLGCDGEGVPAGPDVTRISRFLRLHAYAITPAAARRLRESALPMRQQVDWEVNASGLEVYAVYPSAAGVAWQGSTVQAPLSQGARVKGRQ